MKWASCSAVSSRACSTSEISACAAYSPLSLASRHALYRLAQDSGANGLTCLDAAQLIYERAAIRDIYPQGRIAAGGACRILDTRDGAIALNLPRPCDHDLIPAWLEDEHADGTWPDLTGRVAARDADDLIDRAHLLGLACARADMAVPGSDHPVISHPLHEPAPPPARRPVVLDLSTLWAGPLCGHLFERMGADVIKVESPQRIDGARGGDQRFYGLLNQGKRSLMIDVTQADGRRALLRLIARADIVIESSRFRALRQLGIDAEACVAARPGLTWIAISGHGRTDPQRDWIAYGDDAGAAAGLCLAMHQATGDFAFMGDAIADPITGIQAASAGWLAWRQGGGVLIAVALADAAAHSLKQDRGAFGPHLAHHFRQLRKQFPAVAIRDIDAPVAAAGAHNGAILSGLGPC